MAPVSMLSSLSNSSSIGANIADGLKKLKITNGEQDKNVAIKVVNSILRNRFSCRYFLSKSVDKKIIQEILESARHAPSGTNTQPWEKVYVLAGSVKDAISKDILEAYDTNQEHKSEYDFYPPLETRPTAITDRLTDFGKRFYAPLKIARDDKAGRSATVRRNYEFYGAPVTLVFTIDRALTQSSWIDMGILMQSITVALRAYGLEGVIMQSTSTYHTVLRKHLPIAEKETVVCGLAFGYPDQELVPRFTAKQGTRELSEFVEYFGI